MGKDAFFHQKEKGWFWYEKPKKQKKKALIKIKKKRPLPILGLSPKEILKKQGEVWENSLAQAVLNPTKKNVLNYIGQTASINNQAEQFSMAFKEAIWVNPKFDYSLQGPHSTQAIIAKNEQANQLSNDLLNKISENYGIVFLFDPECPVCHRFSPLLNKFENHYHFQVIPVSSNGKGIAHYPRPETNFDFQKKIKNKIYPSIFLVDPESGGITPISYGYADWSTLIKKTLSAYRRLSSENS